MISLTRISSTLVLLTSLFSFHALAHAGTPSHGTPQRSMHHTYAFTNGQWFDGGGFSSRTLYVVNGILTADQPPHTDMTFDLSGQYVIPPFGEAHNHNIGSYSGEENIKRYLREGIFYVKNPNAVPRLSYFPDKLNIPSSIDLSVTVGSLTATGGHPLGLYRRNLSRNVFREEDGEGGFFFIVDNLSDLNRKWAAITGSNRAFIKTYLVYSEEFAKRKGDEAYFAWKGLNPDLLPDIVRLAHRDQLRVSTHIESAADFHHAVVAGVDEINHMPGFRPDREQELTTFNVDHYRISESDARLAGKKGVTVVTTLGEIFQEISVLQRTPEHADLAESLFALHVRNLRLLHEHGVPIAFGSDQYRGTASDEIFWLDRLRVFDPLTLLKMWCENTVATIFPNRKIGRLEPGYEASFLVLSGNPVEAIRNVRTIEMRFKQGVLLKGLDETKPRPLEATGTASSI